MAILTALDEEVRSPTQLSELLNQPIKRISHHVQFLRDRGAVELVRTETNRGGVEHFYRSAERYFVNAEDWKQLPIVLREAITTVALGFNLKDLVEALEAGSFDELPDRHLSRIRMLLDEQGKDEITDILARTVQEAVRVQERAAQRLAGSNQDGIHTKVHILHFKSPSP